MKPLQITILVDSEMPATNMEGTPLLAQARGADRLAAALGGLGHDVLNEERPLAEIAPGRWVLYFGADPAQALIRCGTKRDLIKDRLVIMDEDRVSAGELLEILAVAFVVTSRSFRNWLDDPRTYVQVFGPVGILPSLGIVPQPANAADRYELFSIPGIPLPEGIVKCCAALESEIS
jgi:hypothetical protein